MTALDFPLLQRLTPDVSSPYADCLHFKDDLELVTDAAGAVVERDAEVMTDVEGQSGVEGG